MHNRSPHNYSVSSLFKTYSHILLIVSICGLLNNHVMAEENGRWNYQTYLDIGYGHSFNNPSNNLWRSKSTTNIFATPKINLAMGYLGKEAIEDSPWGIEIGFQAGVDTDGLIPSPPPEANEPKSKADLLRYLYRANATYRIPVGGGLNITGGLINSFIGYESYLSLGNLNYTKGYLTDNVPFFLIGVQTTYPLNEQTDISLFIVDGWNYLAKSNGNPSYGFQLAWKANSNLTLTQNLYYGPEQLITDTQYWRFFFDSIISWQTERLLLALSIDGGTEKQAEITGNPRSYWWSGAVWASLTQDSWQFSIRPEFYKDTDGIITGASQTIVALTTTIGYDLLPGNVSHKLTAKAEYRYDRSTGTEGGFYKGSDNPLTPNQSSVFLSLVWRFGSL